MYFSLLLFAPSYAMLAASFEWSVFNINNGQWSEMVERDVCVVGGGASGVHAAIFLKV
jgi:ribulose 1,5-bisphosphate synthetase/thiazole synthase